MPSNVGRKKKIHPFNIFKYVFLILASIISIFPFLWMIICATNDAVDINRGTVTFGTSLFKNLQNLFATDRGFLKALGNSAIIAVITTALALLVSSAAGYGFEMFRIFGKLSDSGLSFMGLNTFAAVIIPAISTAFLIFFFRQNTKSFPKDIIEAARLDGLNELQIFFRMYMPVMKSSYAAAAIITFMNSWNNYLWPLVALQSPEKKTVPLILSTMGASYNPDYGMIMAGIVIATLPTALIFFLMQKQFVQGMIGSVK